MPKTIVLTGGGTAGHVLPHLALLPFLKEKFDKIYYIGSTNPNERKVIEGANVPFYELDCVKFRRSLSPKSMLKNLAIPVGFIKSQRRAGKILDELKPDIVFSKGGFVALPVVRAAKVRRIPVAAHESDASLGLANRLSVGCCAKICTTFEMDIKRHKEKFVYTGSLVRPQIYRGNAETVNTKHGLSGGNMQNKGIQNLLVLGGSLGAAKINEAVFAAVSELVKDKNIIHICGRGKTCGVTDVGGAVRRNAGRYIQLEYADNIEDYYAWADIVVSRAGSNTLCELMLLGKPVLFIPLSTGRGDQLDNVKLVLKHSAAGILYEGELDKSSFINSINEVMRNKSRYIKNTRSVVCDGTKKVFDTICGVLCQTDNH